MPTHLVFVALSVLTGAWMADEVLVSLPTLLGLGFASALGGLLLARTSQLQALLLCCICAFCTGAAATKSMPIGPQLEGWTHAQGEIVQRHDGWLILRDSSGPLALSGLQAHVGDKVAVFGTARPLLSSKNTSTWSRERGAFDAGIRTVLQVRRQASLEHQAPSPFAHSAHQAFLDRIVLGRPTPLPETKEELLKRTGTRHLLALSGLHVGLMSALGALTLGGIGRLIALFWRPRGLFFLPAIGGCTSAFLYASNAGFPTSTLRALCVLILGWCCWLAGRKPQPWRLFCLALILSVLLAPQRVKTLSFGLSFCAAAGVIQSFAWTRGLASSLHPIPRWLLRSLAVSLGAQLGTLAWSAWVFQEFPAVGAFSNLVAVPLVGFFILPAGLLSALGVPGAHSVTEKSCDLFWTSLSLLEGPVMHPAVGPIGAFGLVLSILLMQRPSAWLSVVGLSLGLKTAPTQGLTSTHLDVGQGDASLVEIAGHTRVLIDAGPRQNQVLYALRRRGVRRIDALLLSHDHLDHSAGMLAVLREIPVGCLLLPDPNPVSPVAQELAREAKRRGIPFCKRENPLPSLRTIQLKDLSLGINNRSLVVEVRHQGRSFLYTGDLEKTGEQLILDKLLPADALKIAHHGSRGSTTQELLERVQPSVCVISSGTHNRYGHPHAETLDRLRQCEVHQTAETGDVVIHLPPSWARPL